MKMAPMKKHFQLLEINIISAQDLEPISRRMKTYATAWMHHDRKMSSCVDTDGNNNPTWNDKFVFKVDDEFLRRDTSSVMIEIHAKHWFRDVIIGTVRVLVGNLIPPPARPYVNHQQMGMRFVALQVRRQSGRPQGILNIGVALLDSSMRSMPLYRQLSQSAVGFRDLMEGPPALRRHLNHQNDDAFIDNAGSAAQPVLRRTRSERSSTLFGFDRFTPSSSVVAVKGKATVKESSILSIEDCMVPIKGLQNIGKASSVIGGVEMREKPQQKVKKKASSVLSCSVHSKEAARPGSDEKAKAKPKPTENTENSPNGNDIQATPVLIPTKVVLPPTPTPAKFVIGTPLRKGNSIFSDSEVGPSPSEVAAAVMAERRYPLDDKQSSVLDGWSVDESVEGLRSKLERWRTELPPLYDRGLSSSSYKSSQHQHKRRRTDNGNGLFSCFGNILGYECQCICGKPPGRKVNSRCNSQSTLTPGRSFL